MKKDQTTAESGNAVRKTALLQKEKTPPSDADPASQPAFDQIGDIEPLRVERHDIMCRPDSVDCKGDSDNEDNINSSLPAVFVEITSKGPSC